MILPLVVGLAGAAGAVGRYLLDGAVQDRTSGTFPFGTLTVNAIGSAILGLLTGIVAHHGGSATMTAVLGAGFCGGLTTWSAAAWETVRLAEDDSVGRAALFTGANLAVSIVAATLAFAATAR